jgi:nitrogen regulatory protein P-II 1
MNGGDSKHLLVAVINDPETIDEILAGFIELGITGATILNSEGMGSVLSHDIPIFAGLQTLISGSRPQNRMIFSILPASLVDSAVDLLQEVAGDLERPATGIVFTLPVDRVEGLAPELGGEGSPI